MMVESANMICGIEVVDLEERHALPAKKLFRDGRESSCFSNSDISQDDVSAGKTRP